MNRQWKRDLSKKRNNIKKDRNGGLSFLLQIRQIIDESFFVRYNVYTRIQGRRDSMNFDILFEDDQVIVCYKPAGIPTQTSKLGQQDMVSLLKNYLKLVEILFYMVVQILLNLNILLEVVINTIKKIFLKELLIIFKEDIWKLLVHGLETG